MSFIDNTDKITLRAIEDYCVRVAVYTKLSGGSYPAGFKDMRVVIKGNLYEVPRIDWNMSNLGVHSEYLIRKVGNKKAFRVNTLYFLEGHK